jgi:hypothetical protein
MKADGFVLTSEKKDTFRKVLSGETPFVDHLKEYIDDAKHIGSLSDAKCQRILL